jgi:hypothetical protein
MKFHEVGDEQANVIEGIRAKLVTRNLGALPGTQVGVKLATQLGNLLADARDLGIGGGRRREAAQIFYLFFKAIDFLLPFVGRLPGFVFGTHYSFYATT